jgi:hypothetical protein
MEVALKTLWGASRWPGLAESNVVIAHPAWQAAIRHLDQLVAVHGSGIIHGFYGLGKSFLLHRWSERLSPKQYRVLRLAHSSLMGSDLLRQLAKVAGKEPAHRRGDNVLMLSELWKECAPAWPVLAIEEAQDLSVSALEELRLLACSRSDAKPPFSLILCGDNELLPRLNMGVYQALVSRLGFCIRLERWSAETLGEYLHERLREVGIHNSPFDAPAETLLIQAAQGSPRTLNSLLQRSMERAAADQRRNVTGADVQGALDSLPWLARQRPDA